MSTSFPTTKQTIPNPTSTDLLENATAELDHDYQHATINDTVEALQDKVGLDSSATTSTHDYKLSGVTGSDKAASLAGTETLSNKTLTAPQINTGSDAVGDMLYRNGSSATTRLPIGTEDQILTTKSGIPSWEANPSAAAASTTVAGVVELATTAETETGTDATRAVTPDGLHDMTTLAGAAWFLDEDTMSSDSATKVPSQQSVKAYADALRSFANGTTTKNAADANTTQTIAHGLGKTPKKVKITAINFGVGPSSEDLMRQSVTVYNGTTQSSVSFCNNEANTYSGTIYTDFNLNVGSGGVAYAQGVVTFDSTNISIAWTKTGSPTGNYTLLWEAEA